MHLKRHVCGIFLIAFLIKLPSLFLPCMHINKGYSTGVKKKCKCLICGVDFCLEVRKTFATIKLLDLDH